MCSRTCGDVSTSGPVNRHAQLHGTLRLPCGRDRGHLIRMRPLHVAIGPAAPGGGGISTIPPPCGASVQWRCGGDAAFGIRVGLRLLNAGVPSSNGPPGARRPHRLNRTRITCGASPWRRRGGRRGRGRRVATPGAGSASAQADHTSHNLNSSWSSWLFLSTSCHSSITLPSRCLQGSSLLTAKHGNRPEHTQPHYTRSKVNLIRNMSELLLKSPTLPWPEPCARSLREAAAGALSLVGHAAVRDMVG